MLGNNGLRGRGPVPPTGHERDVPQSSRVFSNDVELGRRGDNYKPARTQSWPSFNPLRWRRRRLLILLVGIVFLYLFVHNIPTDLGSIDQRLGRPLRPGHTVDGTPFGYEAAKQPMGIQPPEGAPPKAEEEEGDIDEQSKRYFSGPIKFYRLAASLKAIGRTLGHRENNRNVLFAASSLRSVGNLIPMACEMAHWNRNYVHLVLLGREAIPLEEILEMNGVNAETCAVYFHDARADYSEYSSDLRAEASVAGAMNHINNFAHPQVYITDDSAVEDVFFVKAMRGKASEFGRPVIEVPRGKYEDFLWMTRLDSGALVAWHKPSIDILIHAPPDSSGSLIRLLQSLSGADYAGLTPPRLTIELPATMDIAARNYISQFHWPPSPDFAMSHQSTLRLHHRIPVTQASTEENAVRFVESCYPTSYADSYIVLLSAQTEVSPLFFQYLFYHVLEHRYAAYKPGGTASLYGFSMVAPSTYLNGSGGFDAPTLADMSTDRTKKPKDDVFDVAPGQSAPFLWEAPNADAALIFGDKWIEFHDFLSNRLRAAHVHPSGQKPAKLVSETQPSWVEYMLELVRVRGWKMLFPAQSDGASWVTVHRDLYEIPEEFSRSGNAAHEQEQEAPDNGAEHEESILQGEQVRPTAHTDDRIVLQHKQPLHDLLPFEGDLPELSHLPLLSFDGEKTTKDASFAVAYSFSETFRHIVGGCDVEESRRARVVRQGYTDDLFCFDDVDREYEDLDADYRAAEAIAAERAPVAEESLKATAVHSKTAALAPSDAADDTIDAKEDEVTDREEQIDGATGEDSGT